MDNRSKTNGVILSRSIEFLYKHKIENLERENGHSVSVEAKTTETTSLDINFSFIKFLKNLIKRE